MIVLSIASPLRELNTYTLAELIDPQVLSGLLFNFEYYLHDSECRINREGHLLFNKNNSLLCRKPRAMPSFVQTIDPPIPEKYNERKWCQCRLSPVLNNQELLPLIFTPIMCIY